jgi:hypothetical protein
MSRYLEGTSVRTFHRPLSAMKQLLSSECYRTGAVLSGPGTDDDDDDAVSHIASHVVQSGLFCDLEPNGQKRYLKTLGTICVCLFFPVMLWLPITHALRMQ